MRIVSARLYCNTRPPVVVDSLLDRSAARWWILGTPFGPLVEALPAERRAALDAELERRIPAREPDGPVRRMAASLVARADPGQPKPAWR